MNTDKFQISKMSILDKARNKVRLFVFKVKGLDIGEGAQIYQGNEIVNPKQGKIGKRAKLYKNSTFYIGKNGSFVLGENSHIAPYGYLLIDNNHIQIGENVAIGPYCTMICHSNAIKGPSELFCLNYEDGDITIGNNVFIGAQCTILPGTIIHDNVVIASNSVVKGILESNTLYGGSPVKEIKKIE